MNVYELYVIRWECYMKRKEEYRGFIIEKDIGYLNIYKDGQYVKRIECHSWHNGVKTAKQMIDQMIIKCSPNVEEASPRKMRDELRIIIAGGRDFADYELVKNTLDKYLKDIKGEVVIISGTARGADQLGERYAKENNLMVKRFPADWDRYGKSAGPIRNDQMAKYASETKGVLFAFWDGKSRGTKNMIETAKWHGLRVYVSGY